MIIVLSGIIVASFGQAVSNKATNFKGDGEIFWEEHFDWGDAAGTKVNLYGETWTLPNEWQLTDTDTTGMFWFWTTPHTIISQWTEELPFQSTTADNGYMMLPNDWYNTIDDTDINCNNGFILPLMDFSAHPTVVIKFEQSFMGYSSWTAGVWVSADAFGDDTDTLAHWAYYDTDEGARHKDRPKDGASGQPVIFEANLTAAAGGMSDVTVKINWENTRLYYWVIDDMTFSEAADNDVQIGWVTLEWEMGVVDRSANHWFMMPKSQLGGNYYTDFEAFTRNFGEFGQTGVGLNVKIDKAGTEVYNKTSPNVELLPLYVDTLRINDSIDGGYAPTEYGHYRMTYDIKQDQEEQLPSDNFRVFEFHVTDSVYSHGDDTSDYPRMTGKERYGNLTEGWIDWVRFRIQEDCEVNSLSVFIQGGDESIDFRYVVYAMDEFAEEGDPDRYEMLVSEFVDLDSSMYWDWDLNLPIGTWVTLPFEKDGEGEFFMAGEVYYAGIQYWYDTDSLLGRRNRNMTVGSDKGIKNQPGSDDGYSSGYSIDQIDWYYYSLDNLMIRLNINNDDNIVDGIEGSDAINALEQNYPNPFNRSTDINFALASGAEVNIEVCDITGRKVMEINEGHKPAGKHKVTLNAENLSSGVYYYTLITDNFRETKKMVISR